MDLPLLYIPLLDYLELMPILSKAWVLCNAPAFFFADLWTQSLQLPPIGEVAWIVVPAVAIPLQWIFISLIIVAGRVLCIRITKCMRFASED